MEIPRKCRECPGANFLKNAYDEAADQESAAMRVEAEALVAGETELAKIASSALKKVSGRRKIAEAGLNGIKGCSGYDDGCPKGIKL